MRSFDQELRALAGFAFTRSERKALIKHMEYLSKEIDDRQAKGESTQVMRIAFNAVGKLLGMAEIVGKVKLAINGGKNDN